MGLLMWKDRNTTHPGEAPVRAALGVDYCCRDKFDCIEPYGSNLSVPGASLHPNEAQPAGSRQLASQTKYGKNPASARQVQIINHLCYRFQCRPVADPHASNCLRIQFQSNAANTDWDTIVHTVR